MWWDLTATSTGPSIRRAGPPGVTAGTATVNCSTGPSIRRPAGVDRRDDGRIGVADQDVVAVTDQTCGDSAADRTAAEHDVSHGAQRYNTVKPSVQL